MSISSDVESPIAKIVIRSLEYREENRDGFTPWPKGRKYYIKLKIGDEIRRTGISDRTSTPSWSDTFEFLISNTSTLVLEVYTSNWVRRDNLIGRMEKTVKSLLGQEAVSHTLETKGPIGKKFRSVIAFNITQSVSRPGIEPLGEAPAAHLVAQAKENIDKMDRIPFEQFLEKSKTFFEIAIRISELNSYAKVAFGVLSSAHQVMLAQKNRDERIEQLIVSLDDLLGFILYAGALRDCTTSHSNVHNLTNKQIQSIQLVLEQVTACAYFIIGYTKSRNAGIRMAKNIVSDHDNIIKAYEDKFNKFKADFEQYGILVTEVIVLQTKFLVKQVMNDVEKMASKTDLDDLVYADGASCSPDKACLPGTRQSIIDEIVDWVHQSSEDDSAQILWLYGVAGSGKSAIAHSIAHKFEALGWLGSSFCFDANQPTRGSYHLFSTIARDLADFDDAWRVSLWNTIKSHKAMRKSHSEKLQYENFLVKPSQGLEIIGPIVIVIDALDECGDAQSRRAILDILGTELSSLPKNFRIVVTSRPEADIVEKLQSKQHILCKNVANINILETGRDIQIYIQKELAHMIVPLSQHAPDWHVTLVKKADGLFQWAFTACKFIKQHGRLPSEHFDALVKGLERGGSQLDNLYSKILHLGFPSDDPVAMQRFQEIMGILLIVKKPLPISALGALCLGQDSGIVKSVLVPLGAVLHGVTSVSDPIYPLHGSFRDFLMDKDRGGAFHVEVKEAHLHLTLACLKIMNDNLDFNICKLQTSYEMNMNVLGIKNKIQEHIPNYLRYACTFWAEHLKDLGDNEQVQLEIKKFINTKLLYWLEVLSLTEVMDSAIGSLKDTEKWASEYIQIQEPELIALIQDAQIFVANFWEVISKSVPHIYLSALPFAPEDSIVRKLYTTMFQNLLVVARGRKKRWPPLRNTFEGHTDRIMSISYSPDGKKIASGSDNHTIRVWDAGTGNAVGEPFKGHTDEVWTVSFSPDGKYIVSGSSDKTIRLWDTDTGHTVGEPFKGHTGEAISVSFSPDGRHIVSGSSDQTIRVWDAHTGNTVCGPFKGHIDEVWAVSFSPSGKHIASGSSDQTIRLWDANTGHPLGEPFKGHTGAICAISFSPNGKHIASGSFDQTIRVWDVETGYTVGGPFRGHTDAVMSVMFSPDGKHIASGSGDQTIRLWDVQTGIAVGEPFKGHTDGIWDVSFSPDGKQIASSSFDQTIRMWDTNTGHTVDELFQGHTDGIWAVSFSPDGKYIASGSSDQTIRLWDASTGHGVGDPFKGHTDEIWTVSFSPDGKYIASGSSDQTIMLWDPHTGKSVSAPFKGHTGEIISISFSPDSKCIASGSFDQTIRMWDVSTGFAIGEPFKGHEGDVSTVVFSPDGKYIASGSIDQTIRLWEVRTGNAVGVPFRGHTGWVRSISFSPDSRHIASGSFDQTIRVWDIESGHAVGEPISGHTDCVWCISFSPDGKYIASGSEDNIIMVWDAETGHALGKPFKGHTGPVQSISFSPDGNYIATGSLDQTIRVWKVYTSQISSLSNDVQVSTSQSQPLDEEYIPSDNIDPTLSYFPNGFSIQADGWATANGKILFWVPMSNWNIFMSPENTLIIGENPTSIDFSTFKYGTNWTECKTT